MLSKEECEAIEARCEATINGTWDWDKWPDGNERIHKQDVPALLDAYERMVADRDKWKARAQALERVLRQHASCKSCIHEHTYHFSEPCLSCKDTSPKWQFDESRFAGGDVQDGTERDV